MVSILVVSVVVEFSGVVVLVYYAWQFVCKHFTMSESICFGIGESMHRCLHKGRSKLGVKRCYRNLRFLSSLTLVHNLRAVI